jgi:hypothetical protein
MNVRSLTFHRSPAQAGHNEPKRTNTNRHSIERGNEPRRSKEQNPCNIS